MNEEDLKFPKPEPEKYDEAGLKAGIKYKSTEYIAWEIEKEHYDNFNSVSKERRNEILNCWKKGGITVKEVADKFNVDSKVVGDIIYLNISDITILRSESL